METDPIDALLAKLDEPETAPDSTEEAAPDTQIEDATAIEDLDAPEPDAEEEPVADDETDVEETVPETDGTPDPATEPSADPAPTAPELEELRRQNEQQRQMLQALAEAGRQQKMKAQKAALEAQWAEMDPEDAANAKALWVANAAKAQIEAAQQRVAELEAEKQAEVVAAEEARNKVVVLNHFQKTYKLKTHDVELLEEIDDPWQMEKVAQKIQAKRTAQTQAARTAKANAALGNPALRTGTQGRGSATTPQTYANVDDLIDGLFT